MPESTMDMAGLKHWYEHLQNSSIYPTEIHSKLGIDYVLLTRIVELAHRGATLTDIARQRGVELNTLSELFEILKVIPPDTSRPHSDAVPEIVDKLLVQTAECIKNGYHQDAWQAECNKAQTRLAKLLAPDGS